MVGLPYFLSFVYGKCLPLFRSGVTSKELTLVKYMYIKECIKISKAKVLPVKTTRALARVAKSSASENNTCTCSETFCQ